MGMRCSESLNMVIDYPVLRDAGSSIGAIGATELGIQGRLAAGTLHLAVLPTRDARSIAGGG